MNTKIKESWKGQWIPIQIWKHPKLSWTGKCLWATIESLQQVGDNGEIEKGCFASNAWLAERMNCSEDWITRQISTLIQLGLIRRIAFDGRTRELVAVNQCPEEGEPGQSSESEPNNSPMQTRTIDRVYPGRSTESAPNDRPASRARDTLDLEKKGREKERYIQPPPPSSSSFTANPTSGGQSAAPADLTDKFDPQTNLPKELRLPPSLSQKTELASIWAEWVSSLEKPPNRTKKAFFEKTLRKVGEKAVDYLNMVMAFGWQNLHWNTVTERRLQEWIEKATESAPVEEEIGWTRRPCELRGKNNQSNGKITPRNQKPFEEDIGWTRRPCELRRKSNQFANEP